METARSMTAGSPLKPFYKHLYAQVLTAIVLGVLLGHFYPHLGEAMKPLGDGFIKLIKMLIAPIIFCTVVHGIAGMDDMKKVGRVGIKALVYFEVVTSLALIAGLIVVNILQPGAGMNVDTHALDTKSIQVYTTKAGQQGTVEFLMHIIPNTVVGAFAEGEILQVLLFAILFAFGLFMMGERGRPVLAFIDIVSHTFFGIVGIIMKAAPIGAFGAMAFTIGKYGVGTLLLLAKLMASFYLTCVIFVIFVLGGIAWLVGFNIFKFINYIKEELLIVLGTSSSEVGAATHDREDGKFGLQTVGRRPRDPDRLLLQSGRHLYLPDHDGYLSCASDQYRTDSLATARHHRRVAAHLEGRRRCDRIWVHRAGRDARVRRHNSGCQHCADPGGGSLHVRGACADQLGWQRCRHRRDCQMGERARRRTHAQDTRSETGTRSVRTRGRHGAARSVAAAGIDHPYHILRNIGGDQIGELLQIKWGHYREFIIEPARWSSVNSLPQPPAQLRRTVRRRRYRPRSRDVCFRELV